MGKIIICRIYNQDCPAGFRVLVDRLWPRGISKEKANLDLWAKDIAPSGELRKQFNHQAEKFSEFKRNYFEELKSNPKTDKFILEIREKLKTTDVIFLFSAKNGSENNAAVLKEFIEVEINLND